MEKFFSTTLVSVAFIVFSGWLTFTSFTATGFTTDALRTVDDFFFAVAGLVCGMASTDFIATNGKRIGEVADKLDKKFNLAVT